MNRRIARILILNSLLIGGTLGLIGKEAQHLVCQQMSGDQPCLQSGPSYLHSFLTGAAVFALVALLFV